ncbi:hypothetical protein DPEC_G00066500 [Dallia pectoralis]|uniref:Uncharacterized protein n=1 Tax=Dallia pectoralis TaxID=75939 RepID=A0ACC2H8K5_DALPE|nr:hypothetical protein DPEC_G00066500 [Dallia pectoralis]
MYPPQPVLLGLGATLLSFYISAVLSQIPDPALSPTNPPKKPDPVTSETVVFWGLRLWQVIGIFSMFILAVIITLCCIFKCRIPRTKKEIEARHALRVAAKDYANTLETVPPLNELTEIPGAVVVEKKEDVTTVSGKVDGEKKTKEKKEGKGGHSLQTEDLHLLQHNVLVARLLKSDTLFTGSCCPPVLIPHYYPGSIHRKKLSVLTKVSCPTA